MAAKCRNMFLHHLPTVGSDLDIEATVAHEMAKGT